MHLPEIKRLEAIEVYSNQYGRLFDDRVTAPDGTPGRYLRWEWAHSGVIVIPFDGTAIALSNNFRYPIGLSSFEFPRGFRKDGESPEKAAIRELEEEAGLSTANLRLLGEVFPDTGFVANSVPVVLARVNSRNQNQQRAESMESIAKELNWLPCGELDSHISQGRIRCGVTLAAIALFKSQIDS